MDFIQNYFLSSSSCEKTKVIDENEFQVIRLNGTIDKKAYDAFIYQYEQCSQEKPIYFELTTTGGMVSWAFMIGKVLQSHPMEVVCRVPYYALSSGTLLALSCSRIEMSQFSCLGGFNPSINGYDNKLITKTIETVMKSGFKESFTELLGTYFHDITAQMISVSKTQMIQLLEKNYENNAEELYNYFTESISHDEQLSYNDLTKLFNGLIDVTLITNLNLTCAKKNRNGEEANKYDMNDVMTMLKQIK